MKLFAPEYYKKFKCIADRCRHSCCIGWEIDVDRDALSRFRALGERGEKILATIDFESETPHYKLLPGERCPHLDGTGLCRIITECGEDYLCDICREHPRFYNFPVGRCEVGLGAACEEAARLILSCENYMHVSQLSDIGEAECEESEKGFDAVGEREAVYKILSDVTRPYPERLSEIYRKYGVSPLDKTDGDWRSLISELEYLDGKSKEIFLSYLSASFPASFSFAERALAYFIYRHTASAESPEDFAISLGLSLLLERLFSSVTAAYSPENIEAHALALRLISEEIEYNEENTDLIKSEFM